MSTTRANDELSQLLCTVHRINRPTRPVYRAETAPLRGSTKSEDEYQPRQEATARTNSGWRAPRETQHEFRVL